MQSQYSFRNNQVDTIIHTLIKGNKLQLSETWRHEEEGRTDNPKHFLFPRMLGHLMRDMYILKFKI